jgi:hypothetical protein
MRQLPFDGMGPRIQQMVVNAGRKAALQLDGFGRDPVLPQSNRPVPGGASRVESVPDDHAGSGSRSLAEPSRKSERLERFEQAAPSGHWRGEIEQ